MEPSDRIPFVASLDDFDGPEDLIDVLALGPFVAGVQPAARSVRLQRIPREAALLPAGIAPIRVADSAGSRSVLAEGDGSTMRSIWWSDGSAKVLVVARDADLASDILNQPRLMRLRPCPTPTMQCRSSSGTGSATARHGARAATPH